MRSGSNRTKRRLAEMSCTWLSGYTGNSCMSCNRRITSLSYWNRCSGYFDWFQLDVSVCCCWYNHNPSTLIVLMKHILVPFCDTMHLQINFDRNNQLFLNHLKAEICKHSLIDWRNILYIHSWSPEDEYQRCWWSPNFTSGATSRLKSLACRRAQLMLLADIGLSQMYQYRCTCCSILSVLICIYCFTLRKLFDDKV